MEHRFYVSWKQPGCDTKTESIMQASSARRRLNLPSIVCSRGAEFSPVDCFHLQAKLACRTKAPFRRLCAIRCSSHRRRTFLDPGRCIIRNRERIRHLNPSAGFRNIPNRAVDRVGLTAIDDLSYKEDLSARGYSFLTHLTIWPTSTIFERICDLVNSVTIAYFNA